MGTYYRIVAIDHNHSNKLKLKSLLEEELTRVNYSISNYDAKSQLSQFNKSHDVQWHKVTKHLGYVVKNAIEISTLTHGYFDPTIAPLVNLWNFGPHAKPQIIPSDDEIDHLLDLISIANIEVNYSQMSIRKRITDVHLDLSAIGKGFAVDQLAIVLEGEGIVDYLVDIGGELKAKGSNKMGKAWSIGIEKPLSSHTKSIQQVIKLNDKAIATSGDYRDYFEFEGKRYSHILNPITGKPIDHNLASVSVVSEDCMIADAYATAILAMGEEIGYQYALQSALPVYMILRQGSDFITKFTPQMKTFLVNK